MPPTNQLFLPVSLPVLEKGAPTMNRVLWDFLNSLATAVVMSDQASAPFNKATTVLSDVVGLTAPVSAKHVYSILATLYVSADATGGQKYALGGTATATSISYDTVITDFTGLTVVAAARSAALGAAVALAGNTHTAFQTVIRGTMTAAMAGNLTVQFAQNSASGTSSILAGSTFSVQDIT